MRSNKNISIIVAVAENDAIGKDNSLLWHLSDDLKRFKQLTTNHTIIMGRNTFLSLPKRPLPNRRHIVITDQNEKFEGCEIASSIENAISLADKHNENFIIGGASIYKQFYSIADTIYLTKVHCQPDADTWFNINKDEWNEIENTFFPANEKNEYSSNYIILKRK